MAVTLVSEVFTCTLSGTSPLNGPSSFDGKNLWFYSLVGGVHKIDIVEYWGPFNDSVDNVSHLRWAEIEVDMLTLNNLGPKVRLIKSITVASAVKQFIRYESGITTAMLANMDQVKISETTYEIISTTNIPKPTPVAPVVTHPAFEVSINGACNWFISSSDTRHYQETPNFYYSVSAPICDQKGTDQQSLNRYHKTSGALLGSTLIPGRKQVTNRYIAYLPSGHVFVGSLNEGCVFVFEESTGNFLVKLLVNRDVEEIFTYENTVYITSRLGLFSKVDSALIVTDYGNSAMRTYFIGLLNAAATTPPPIVDFKFWNVSADVLSKFDAGATVWSIVSGKAAYYRKDTRVGKQFELDATYKGCGCIPALTYQYFIDGALTTVTVPPHLFLRNDTNLKVYRLPGLYKGVTTKSIGGVMAVSTGPLHYKGDLI